MNPRFMLFLVGTATFFLYAVFAMIYILSIQKATQDWLILSEGRRMQFREKPARRREMMIGCWLIPFMTLPCTIDTPRLICYYVLWAALFHFLVYQAPPKNTLIDGGRWVYEKTAGNRWRPRTVVRSLDEIAGVQARSYGSVVLHVKGPMSVFVRTVDKKHTRSEAIAMAEKISRTTGIPLLAPQKPQ